YDVSLANYLPVGTTLNDPNWDDTDGDGVANLITPIAGIVSGALDNSVSITITINPDYQGEEIVDIAEITFATATDDSGVNTADIDSAPDATNDDIIGGDNITDNTGGDEDDHDFAQVPVQQTFDLALINTLSGSTPGPFTAGSMVTFDMTVTNQGTVDAYDVELTNYIPMGLDLADSGWAVVGSNAVLLTEIPFIAAGDDAVVSITYMVSSGYQGNTIRDWAEISFGTDSNGSAVNATDVDSQADGINFNQAGETDDLTDDNTNNEDGTAGGDEDDHDPVEIVIEQTFDLALSQQYTSFVDNDGDGTISAGDDVTFNITVFNQGSLDASNVVVTNYVPVDMNFNAGDNPDFADNAGSIESTVAALPTGSSTTISITLEIAAAFQGTEIINWAEISDDNSGVADEDSTPDAINFNQSGETDDLNDDNVVLEDGTAGGDEDDHDPALVTVGQVFDLALINVYNAPNFVDNDGNGVISPGDDVTFDITVSNQGTLDA
ncbi:MAG: DUF11 domain-containing protein, partial [Methylococcales bacterium]|nr:DUF11 domain-containing protein [Methylococcales bacterium]